ncbi:MAG TPA: glycerophosphodiester phosphodiesterase family protein [Candidatus Pelagibacter bacterium]|jgi:glycerophosphoryl diester phosphodiesterase|nr:glycerophosphodiester phosphodiesterase family protein [Candidatus Pelagibacter bacterium]
MTHLIIHRGIASKQYKENLLKSFKQSFKKGYGIETDIHATKDNEFICFHDFTLNRIFKKKSSVKNMEYSQIKKISAQNKKPIPLLKDLLKTSKNKYSLFIEIKPTFSKKLLQKLLKETSKFSKCIFISYQHKNIYNLLKIKSCTKVGLTFSPSSSVKTIIKKSNNRKVDCLILNKFFLKNKKIQDLKIKKYYYTIKTKSEFNKYSRNNNLIFENL